MRVADTSHPPTAKRLLATLTALTASFLIGACSGESESAQDTKDTGVASVTGSQKNAKDTNGSPVAQVERPLIRPDTSDEEEHRIDQLYQDCLAKQGVKMLKNDDGSYKGVFDRDTDPRYPEAQKKCQSKEPETLTQRSAREDPDFRDKADRWVRCLRSHDVVATVDDEGFLSFDDGSNLEHKIKWADKCEAEVFLAK
ncbi:hypothetical protein [Streptomyces sp. NPDC127084]|uniref:hypothetical protein n=1 Tax=Streptomyces sp. NPDC127084 TaxID=3347133 RepID=UPI003648448F